MSGSSSSTTSSQTPPDSESQLIPNLPDDVALNCLARVPRSFHPNLSLVSKSWHSTLRSSALFTTRSLLQTTETYIFLNLSYGWSSRESRWYILLPNFSKNPQNSLVPLPPMPGPIPYPPEGAAVAVLGPKIYVMGGGSVNKNPLNMWVFDCRFNRWERGPNMRQGRQYAASGVVGGKIYVIGGCGVDNVPRLMNWAEVYDPVADAWAPVPSPIEVRKKWIHGFSGFSAVIGGKVYAKAGRQGLVYDVGVGEWGYMPKMLDLGWQGRAALVGEVLYCYDSGMIKGYDVEVDAWKKLKGVKELLPKISTGPTMVNYDGRLCVVWHEFVKEQEIMFAEIEVWKDKDGNLNGNILWSDVIVAGPSRLQMIAHCLAARF